MMNKQYLNFVLEWTKIYINENTPNIFKDNRKDVYQNFKNNSFILFKYIFEKTLSNPITLDFKPINLKSKQLDKLFRSHIYNYNTIKENLFNLGLIYYPKKLQHSSHGKIHWWINKKAKKSFSTPYNLDNIFIQIIKSNNFKNFKPRSQTQIQLHKSSLSNFSYLLNLFNFINDPCISIKTKNKYNQLIQNTLQLFNIPINIKNKEQIFKLIHYLLSQHHSYLYISILLLPLFNIQKQRNKNLNIKHYIQYWQSHYPNLESILQNKKYIIIRNIEHTKHSDIQQVINTHIIYITNSIIDLNTTFTHSNTNYNNNEISIRVPSFYIRSRVRKLNKSIRELRSEVYKDLIKVEQNKELGRVIYDEGWKYMELTLDGKRVCKELPKYGQYIDGRYYSSFHILKKEDRERVMWGDERIKEIYDIKHCYPTLLLKVIKDKVDINEYYRWYGLMFNDSKDVYNQILRYNDIEVKKQNRDKIKIYVQKYINGTKKSIEYNRKHFNRNIINRNQPKFANAVYKFMEDKFPKIHNLIMNYIFEQKETFNKETLRYQKRNIKKLCHDLQIIQRELIEKICKKIKEKGEKYITLFDGIYVKQHFNYDINYEEMVKEYFN